MIQVRSANALCYFGAMQESWLKYLRVRAPRYTSYPPALHFDASVTAGDFSNRLDAVPQYEPLSLYVHIPFCRQLCWYCGCNMRVENSRGRALRYIDSLRKEIALVGRRLGGRGVVQSMHFGGGTPNFLEPRDISAILSAVELNLGLTDHVRLTIELDPRLIRPNDIAELAALGFNRMSLGVQDFDPEVQAAINRIQRFELVESAVGEMRRAAIDDISFDLLCGLPKQTFSTFADTLDKAAALAPDRIAVYGYAHIPEGIPHQKLIDPQSLPGEELRAQLAELADRRLVEHGYRRVGFDHYARPGNALLRAAVEGRLRRNFQGFTDDSAATVLALGASAISSVDGLFAQNLRDIGAYCARIEQDELATERGLIPTRRESAIGQAIQQLLCTGAADISSALSAAAPGAVNRICARLDALEADGLIEWRGDTLVIAEGARLLSRVVAMALDPDAPSWRRELTLAGAV